MLGGAIMKELSVLYLEQEIKEKRCQLVDIFLLNQSINLKIYSEEDKLSIYTILLAKAEDFKKKGIDKCFE